MKYIIFIILIFFAGCCEPPKLEQVKIITTYREIRLGSEDGTTVVERSSGQRVKLRGRLGKKGDVITVEDTLLNSLSRARQ